MRIIPAIDIIDGKCVRLSQGDYQTKKIYNESPLEVAKEFEANGIKHLHLVDLEGAKAKFIVNLSVLESICSETQLKVDFGGGIKSSDDLKSAFNAGATQITAGSIAVSSPDLVKEWLRDFGYEKIILGADVKGEEIMIQGWTNNSGKSIYSFVRDFLNGGLRNLISTDIANDGMLNGPSFELYKGLIQEFSELNVIASGGVASVKDLDELKRIGVDGVIIGKAIYENKIDLKELRNYVD